MLASEPQQGMVSARLKVQPLIEVFKRQFKYCLKNGPLRLRVLQPDPDTFAALTMPVFGESKDELSKKSKKLVSFCAYSTPLFRRHFISDFAVQIQALGENVEEGMNEFLRQALSMEARIGAPTSDSVMP